jgi:hypothetical protein
MVRKKWQLDNGPGFVLCDEALLEKRDHLFFDCAFAQQCWAELGIIWNMDLQFTDQFLQARRAFTGPCFMEVMACVAWNIWKERNAFIFQGKQPSYGHWRVRFQHVMLHQFRVKTSDEI